MEIFCMKCFCWRKIRIIGFKKVNEDYFVANLMCVKCKEVVFELYSYYEVETGLHLIHQKRKLGEDTNGEDHGAVYQIKKEKPEGGD